MTDITRQSKLDIDYLTVALHEAWTFSDIKALKNYIIWCWVME